MLKGYLQKLLNSYSQLSKLNGDGVSFLELLKAIGYGLGLSLIVALILAGICLIIWMPLKFRKWLIRKELAHLKEIDKEHDANKFVKEIAAVSKAIKLKNLLFAAIMIFVYIPTVVPIGLFVLDNIFGLFH